jgi:Lrp/AsnC family transcriptional regulator, leucine-responsive regulatory protein
MLASMMPTPSNRKLDGTDHRLLAALRANGRKSAEDLSRELALSRPAIRDRMRRLEALGVISGYTIVIDWETLGYPILAFVQIRTGNTTCEEALQIIDTLSNDGAAVEERYPITGEWCLFAKIRARTSKDLALFLDSIKASGKFTATSTTLALSTSG